MTAKKVAIVGLGKIGLFHLSILKTIPEAEIVGLVDEKGSVQKTVKGMGIDAPFFASVDALLDNAKPDGIFACVPPAFNRSIAEKCLPKGIAVFLEKPISARLDDAQKICRLVNGKLAPANAVGYMVAYYPIFREAKKLILEGMIGEVKHYAATISLGEVFKKQEGWRQNPAVSGGGAVTVLGSHLLYLIQSFFGLPERVSARTIKLFSQVEDIGQAQFDHSGDLTGTFQVSWSKPGYSEMGIQIEAQGTRGTLEISESALSLYAFEGHPRYPQGWKVWYPWDFEERQKDPGKVALSQQGFAEQDNDFIRSIGSDCRPLVTWSEGLKVQRMIEGIYRSSQDQGRSIALPE